MIDFSGANLTGADVRGVDLNGMVNFSGAILHDVDFSGSVTDKGHINLSGADIRNVRGLHILQHHHNKYLNELNSFSESIKQQFKTYNIPTEQVKSIEESMKALVKEVEDLEDKEELSSIEKQNLRTKFLVVIEQILRILPNASQDIDTFASLESFSKLIGESIHQLVINRQKELGTSTSSVVSIHSDNQIPSHYPETLQAMRQVGIFGHAVAKSNEELKALIANASVILGPGFFAPARNHELIDWLLENGFRIGWSANLMTIGPYQEPLTPFLPSLAY